MAMGLVKRIVELKEQNNPYPSSDVGLLKIKPVKITLKEKKMQCLTVFQRQDVCLCLCSLKEELDRMVASGVITEIKGPTEWCAPIVAVPKKNKEQIRICVDLKNLTRAVKREKYILPTID